MLTSWNTQLHPFNSRAFSHMRSLQREMDALFGGRRSASTSADTAAGRSVQPQLSVEEHSEAYQLRVELPGLGESEVELSLDGRTLQLRAVREISSPKDHELVRQERSSLRLQREIQLPDDVDGASIEATMKHGVLTLRLPRIQPASPRVISVTGAA